MTDIDGLIERLRSLSRAEHDDISIGDEAATALADMRGKLEAAEGENTRLRAALANSDQPCAYCSLPKDEWAKCQHGFPGCDRADDAMGCPELGASLDLSRIRALLVEAVEGLKPFERALAVINPLPHENRAVLGDDVGMREFIPRIWPTLGDLRRAAALVSKIEQEKATWPTP